MLTAPWHLARPTCRATVRVSDAPRLRMRTCKSCGSGGTSVCPSVRCDLQPRPRVEWQSACTAPPPSAPGRMAQRADCSAAFGPGSNGTARRPLRRPRPQVEWRSARAASPPSAPGLVAHRPDRSAALGPGRVAQRSHRPAALCPGSSGVAPGPIRRLRPRVERRSARTAAPPSAPGRMAQRPDRSAAFGPGRVARPPDRPRPQPGLPRGMGTLWPAGGSRRLDARAPMRDTRI